MCVTSLLCGPWAKCIAVLWVVLKTVFALRVCVSLVSKILPPVTRTLFLLVTRAFVM